MEYIKYGADEARREFIDGDTKLTFNIYDLDLLGIAKNIISIKLGNASQSICCGDDKAAEQAYQLIKKDWDWWLEQEAANLDDDDEEGDC